MPSPSTAEHTATPGPIDQDDNYRRAIASLENTLGKLKHCSEDEKALLRKDLAQLQEMLHKLTTGRIEIVIFGEISTGKSALINALVGRTVAGVDVKGGWTKEVWRVQWDSCDYQVPGIADSEVVLVDTPGLNEVGGAARAELAIEAAERADLILFVTDSDLNDTEFTALQSLAAIQKPLIIVLNKVDLYPPDELQRLLDVLRNERLANLIDQVDLVTAAASPREVEYIIESEKGKTRSEWRKPAPRVDELKLKILELLAQDGTALIALNGALYAADKSDRIASLRVQLRTRQANQLIWSYATVKSVAVALNPVPAVDTLGGMAVDATMVGTLAHVYGLEMSWMHARRLAISIVKAAGWVMLAEVGTGMAAMAFKALTLGWGTVVTAVPQGAAAGYGSYIVGQAARYYFEHGSSWGPEGPKAVVKQILDETDKESVLERLKEEIRKKIGSNRHADE